LRAKCTFPAFYHPAPEVSFSIASFPRARGTSASEHLDKLTSDLTDSELKIAEDNTRLKQHVLEESFSEADKETMLANLVDNLQAQIAQKVRPFAYLRSQTQPTYLAFYSSQKAKNEEMVAAGGLDYLVRKLDVESVLT
jgi:hypothetical protein